MLTILSKCILFVIWKYNTHKLYSWLKKLERPYANLQEFFKNNPVVAMYTCICLGAQIPEPKLEVLALRLH